MTTAQSIEFMAGASLLVLGLSYLLCTGAWARWLDHLAHDLIPSSLKIGAANLAAGTFVLGFHWIWQGSQVVVTVIGALMTFKGIVHLLFPSWLSVKLKWFAACPQLTLRLAGLLLFSLGAFIFYDLMMQPGVQDYLCKPFQCGKTIGS